jgi:hypothetical protein
MYRPAGVARPAGVVRPVGAVWWDQLDLCLRNACLHTSHCTIPRHFHAYPANPRRSASSIQPRGRILQCFVGRELDSRTMNTDSTETHRHQTRISSSFPLGMHIPIGLRLAANISNFWASDRRLVLESSASDKTTAHRHGLCNLLRSRVLLSEAGCLGRGAGPTRSGPTRESFP